MNSDDELEERNIERFGLKLSKADFAELGKRLDRITEAERHGLEGTEERHEHTPELRERRHYDPAVILADAWVCAECASPLLDLQDDNYIETGMTLCTNCGAIHDPAATPA